MSNPLAAFRKHQNVLLAVFGVLIMLSFAVGPIIQGCQQNSATGPRTDTEVVRYRSGSIKESELNSMRFSRQALAQYMATVGQIATTRGATIGGSFVPQRFDDESLVQTRLMAEEAQRLGIVVDQDEIVRFLKEYTGGQIKPEEFSSLLKDITNNRMSESQFFSAMQKHLMAARFGGLVQQGLAVPTPTAMWDYFQRLNRRVEAEVVAYPVSNYVSSDPVPDDKLRAVYEEGKDRFADPSSSEPAFKQRKRVAIAYVKCVRDEYIAAEKPGVTDKDIEEYYENNKETFRNETLPPVGDLEVDPTADADTFGSIDPADTSDDIDTATEETTPDDNSGCGPQEPEDESDGESNDDTAEEDSEESDDGETTDEDTQAGDNDGGDNLTESNDSAVDSGDAPGADETDADELDEEPETSDSSDEVVTPSGDSTSDEDDLANLPDEPEAPEFKPLEEVRDTIIETIAGQRAEPKFEQAKNLVESTMRDYFNDYTAWSVGATEGATPPNAPDLGALAAAHRFTAGSVPLVDGFEMTEVDPVTDKPKYEISGSYDIGPTGIVYFVQAAYDDRLRMFESRRIRGIDFGTDYIYWKTEETEAKTLTFEECKDQVEAFVKRVEAAQKARGAAEQEAAAIASTGKSLTEYFTGKPNVKVIETGVFSWMTMLPQQRPTISEVPGIRFAGNAFMKDVFALKQGEYGVALDSPQKVAYLVYLKADVESPETLREIYARTGPTFDTMAVQRAEMSSRVLGWYKDFLASQQLKWMRQPQ